METEDYAPPPTNRIQNLADLKHPLTVGSKIVLLDTTWNILFPQYRSIPEPCICTVFIDKLLLNERYGCGIVDIVTESGHVFTPAGILSVCSFQQITEAVAATQLIRNNTYLLPDNSALCNLVEPFTDDYYGELAEQLQSSLKAILPLPEDSNPKNFQQRIQVGLRRQGVYTKTRINKDRCELLVELKHPRGANRYNLNK